MRSMSSILSDNKSSNQVLCESFSADFIDAISANAPISDKKPGIIENINCISTDIGARQSMIQASTCAGGTIMNPIEDEQLIKETAELISSGIKPDKYTDKQLSLPFFGLIRDSDLSVAQARTPLSRKLISAQNLRLFNWGIEGIFDKAKELYKFMIAEFIDIACLQHTYLHPDQRGSLMLNFPGYQMIDSSVGKYNGVLILFKNTLTVRLHDNGRDAEGRYLYIRILNGTNEFDILTFLCPGGMTSVLFRHFCSFISSDKPFIACGDSNSDIRALSFFLEQYQLKDIYPNDEFSFQDSEELIQKKCNHFLIPRDWMLGSIWPPLIMSRHTAVIVQLWEDSNTSGSKKEKKSRTDVFFPEKVKLYEEYQELCKKMTFEEPHRASKLSIDTDTRYSCMSVRRFSREEGDLFKDVYGNPMRYLYHSEGIQCHCGKYYGGMKNFKTHYQKNHSPILCPFCLEICQGEDNFKKHFGKHFREWHGRCIICDFEDRETLLDSINSAKQFFDHMKTHEKVYLCLILCRIGFNWLNVEEFREHMERIHRYQCNISNSFEYKIIQQSVLFLCKHCAGKQYISKLIFKPEQKNDVISTDFNIDTLGESKSGNYQIYFKEVNGRIEYGYCKSCCQNKFEKNYLSIFGRNLSNFASKFNYRTIPYAVKQALRIVYIQTVFEYTHPIESGNYARSVGNIKIAQKNSLNPIFVLRMGFILQEKRILHNYFPFHERIKEYHNHFLKVFGSLWDYNVIYRDYYSAMLRSGHFEVRPGIQSDKLFMDLQVFFQETMKKGLSDLPWLYATYGKDVFFKLIFWFQLKRSNTGHEYVHIMKGSIKAINLGSEDWLYSSNLYSKIFFELYPNGIGDILEARGNLAWYAKALIKSALDWFQMTPEWCALAYVRQVYNEVRTQKLNVRTGYGALTAAEAEAGLSGADNNLFKKMSEKIVGSVSYLKEHYYQVAAFSALNGSPNAFITLTFDERSLPDLNNLLNPDYFISQQPATVTVHASERLNLLNIELLRWSSPTEEGLLGYIKAYFIRAEYQDRGTIHYHMLLWLSNPEDYKNIIVSTKPDEAFLGNLVFRHQIHKHQENCNWKGLGRCKYGYPRPHSTNISYDEESKTMIYPCKEGEEMIVPYIPKILLAWRANIDVKYIEVNDDSSLSRYVIKYMHKESEHQRGVSELESFMNQVFTSSELTGRIIQSKQIRTNVTALRLDWSPNNTKILKLKKDIRKIKEVDPDSTDVFYHKKIDIYHNRHQEYEDYSYAEYFENFTIKTTEPKTGLFGQDMLGNFVIKNRQQKAIYIQPTTSTNLREQAFMHLVLFVPHRKYHDLLPAYQQSIMLKDSEIVAGWKNYDFHDKYYTDVYLRQELAHKMMNTSCYKFIEFIKKLSGAASKRMRPRGIADIKEQKPEKVFKHFSASADVTFEKINKRTQSLYGDQFFKALESLDHLYDKLKRDQKSIFLRISQAFVEYILNKRIDYGISIQGEAGTGKSFIIEAVKRMGLILGLDVEIVAPTGQAACNAKGVTVHKLFNLPKGAKHYGIQGIGSILNTASKRKIKSIDVLIIDEISMVGAETLNLIHMLMSNNGQAYFGGKLVLFFGDFLQLNPVKQQCTYEWEHWSTYVAEKYRLEENMRQSADEVFHAILSEMRYGQLSEKSLQILKSRICKQRSLDLNKTYIFGKKKLVNEHIEKCLAYSSEKVFTIAAQEEPHFAEICHRFGVDDATRIKWKKYYERKIVGQVVLRITLNMPLVLLSNTSDPLFVNGSIVTIKEDNISGQAENLVVHLMGDLSKWIELSRMEQYIRFSDNAAIMVQQFPLVPAYAMTVHKLQGQTLDKGVINASNSQMFADSQAYTAFSRFRRLEDFELSDLGPDIRKLFIVNNASVDEFKAHIPVSILPCEMVPSSILLGLNSEEGKQKVYENAANDIVSAVDLYIGRGKNSLDEFCQNPESYSENDIRFGKRNPDLEARLREIIDRAKQDIFTRFNNAPASIKIESIRDALVKQSKEARDRNIPKMVKEKIDQAFQRAQKQGVTFGKRPREPDEEQIRSVKKRSLPANSLKFIGIPSLDNTCYFNSLSILLAKAEVNSRITSYKNLLVQLDTSGKSRMCMI